MSKTRRRRRASRAPKVSPSETDDQSRGSATASAAMRSLRALAWAAPPGRCAICAAQHSGTGRCRRHGLQPRHHARQNSARRRSQRFQLLDSAHQGRLTPGAARSSFRTPPAPTQAQATEEDAPDSRSAIRCLRFLQSLSGRRHERKFISAARFFISRSPLERRNSVSRQAGDGPPSSRSIRQPLRQPIARSSSVAAAARDACS